MIKDLGKLKKIDVEVFDINNGICLSQIKYCFELLHELLGCKPLKSPLDSNVVIKV